MKPILVADDDEDDFFFTSRALSKATPAPIIHVESGAAAIDYLAGRGAYADRNTYPFPSMLLLDLKMTDVDGHGVLRWVRDNLPRSSLQIFVLTGSDEIRDRKLVEASGIAAGYFVKPLGPQQVGSIFKPTATEQRDVERN
jgi:CheY-like chemotaxis protein